MGSGADLIASVHSINRQEADAQAMKSQQKACDAQKKGFFKSIVSVTNPVKGNICSIDECLSQKLPLSNSLSCGLRSTYFVSVWIKESFGLPTTRNTSHK